MESNCGSAIERQSLKDKLMAIILIESSKAYNEMDSDLVKECVDFLMELEGKERLTKAEIEKRVNEIPFRGKAEAIGSYAKKRLRVKRLALVAAVLALIIALLGSIIAISTSDPSDELARRINRVVNAWIPGTSKVYDGITVYKYNETRTYSSIEEFAKSEGIEILYPTWLPEDEKIIRIIYTLQNGAEKYILQTENPTFGIGIDINEELTEGLKANCKKKEIAGLTVYYGDTPQYIQADFVYKNNHYSVSAYSGDDLFGIIENLKEIK